MIEEICPPMGSANSPRSASGQLALRRAGLSLGAGALGIYGLGAVATYAPTDPSLNVATGESATNLFGAPGAMLADVLVQSMGAAAPVLLLALAGAGIARVVRKRLVSPISSIRLLAGASGVALAAACLSQVPAPAAWPLGAGLGGVAGDGLGALLYGLVDLTGAPFGRAVAGLLAAAGAMGGLGFAFRVNRDDLRKAAGMAARRASDAGARAQTALKQVTDNSRPDAETWPYARAIEDHAGAAAAQYVEPIQEAPAPTYEPAPEPTPVRVYTPPERETPLRPPPVSQPAPQPAMRASAPATPAPGAPPRPGAFMGKPFRLPSLDLLTQPKARVGHADGASLQAASKRLAAVLADFGVQGEIVAARPGPVVTLFELEPAPGVKSSRVIGLSDDIARSMSATAARVAVIPGRNAIGIELPNPKRETVYLRGLLGSAAFVGNQGGLPLALGETIEGEPFAADLTKMPHLLIAGTTGSGKSVGINAMILSLLFRLPPEQCQFLMIDPKMLELSVYEGIPHLLHPVVTDPKKAVVALKWVVREMEERYRKMAKVGVRNIAGFNERVLDAIERGEKLERTIHAGFDQETGEPIYQTTALPLETMPYIVVVIDEMADLMITAGKEIETAVQRLAQMARAAGIHVIMATQRPSVDVITGTIKANFPTRISFSVTSKIDSRTILGEQGAEQLLGMGDLLFMAGGGRIRRLHGPFVSDAEVERAVAMLKAQGSPIYRADITEDPDAKDDDDDFDLLDGMGDTSDDIFDRAVAIVQRDRKASTSYLQRRLQIGYNRAATLIERMEKEGVVSSANHAGKRDILVPALHE